MKNLKLGLVALAIMAFTGMANAGGVGYIDYAKVIDNYDYAKQVTKEDYYNYDYILCADSNNIRNTIRITGADRDDKIKLLLDFALDSKKHGKSIADSWYTGNFSDTYNDIVDGLEGFLKFLEKNS